MSTDEQETKKATRFSVDSEQFHSLLQLFPKPNRSADRIDNIIKLAPVIFTLITFGAIVFKYFTYQNRADELLLQEKKVSTQFNQAQLRALELSDQIQRSQADDRQRELILSNQLKKSEIELAKLSAKGKQQEVSFAETYRYEPMVEIVPTKIRDLSTVSSYEVDYKFEFINTSTQPFELSFWMVDYFLADLPELDTSEAAIMPLNFPPQRWSPKVPAGVRVWRHLGSLGAKISELTSKDVPVLAAMSDVEFVTAETTGLWKPNEKAYYSQRFLVYAPHAADIGFVSLFCFNKCKKDEDLYGRTDIKKLDTEERKKF